MAGDGGVPGSWASAFNAKIVGARKAAQAAEAVSRVRRVQVMDRFGVGMPSSKRHGLTVARSGLSNGGEGCTPPGSRIRFRPAKAQTFRALDLHHTEIMDGDFHCPETDGPHQLLDHVHPVEAFFRATVRFWFGRIHSGNFCAVVSAIAL